MKHGWIGTKWSFEPISEFQLRYDKAAPRMTPSDPYLGSYIGSGTGEAKGPLPNGKIRWDLFEAEGETLCAANFRGLVENTEGTRAKSDCLGYFGFRKQGSRFGACLEVSSFDPKIVSIANSWSVRWYGKGSLT